MGQIERGEFGQVVEGLCRDTFDAVVFEEDGLEVLHVHESTFSDGFDLVIGHIEDAQFIEILESSFLDGTDVIESQTDVDDVWCVIVPEVLRGDLLQRIILQNDSVQVGHLVEEVAGDVADPIAAEVDAAHGAQLLERRRGQRRQRQTADDPQLRQRSGDVVKCRPVDLADTVIGQVQELESGDVLESVGTDAFQLVLLQVEVFQSGAETVEIVGRHFAVH